MNFLSFLLAGYALFGQPFVSPFMEGGNIGGHIGNQIGGQTDNAELRVCCEKILREGPRIWFLNDRNGKMKLQVRGIYLHGSVLLFLLRLTNRSSRDYVVDGIRFQPANKDGGPLYGSRAGHAALEPVFIYDSAKMVPSNGYAASIFVLPRFTLPAGGKLWIDVHENNGEHHDGRQLHIPVNNWLLARARLI